MSVRWSRVLPLSTMAAVVVWWGCESGVEGPPAYAPSGPNLPLDDAGVAADATAAHVGPIVTSRSVVHVPRGETHTVHVTVDTSGKNGVAQLTAALASADIRVESDHEGENRFVLKFIAKADASPVDTRVVLHATTDRGDEIGTRELRVLVGLPATRDESFGEKGAVKVGTPVPSARMFAVVGSSVLVAGENHDVWEVASDGKARVLCQLDLAPDCTVTGLAADLAAVLVSGYCGADKLFVAQAPRGIAPDAPPVPSTTVSATNIFGIARAQDAGFYLAESVTGSAIVGVAGGAATDVPLSFPTQLVPGTTGFFVLAHDGAQAHVARLAGSPPALLATYGDGGVTSIELPGSDGNEPTVAAAVSTSGRLVVATSVDSATAADDRVFLHSFTATGELTGDTQIEGAVHATIAADGHDRVVVAAETATEVRLERFHADAAADEPFTVSVTACSPSAVGVDDEGMIVVLCGGKAETFLHRFWP